jgi:hypothetical protein
MPQSWNEIKDRALAFSRDWAGTTKAGENRDLSPLFMIVVYPMDIPT